MSRKKTDPEPSTNGQATATPAAAAKAPPPANPFQRRMAEMRQACLEAMTPQDVQDIIRQLLVKARRGDVTAAKLALSYGVGRPAKAVEPDRVEIDEWKLHAERPKASEVAEVAKTCFTTLMSNLTVQCNDLVLNKEMLRRFDKGVGLTAGQGDNSKPAAKATGGESDNGKPAAKAGLTGGQGDNGKPATPDDVNLTGNAAKSGANGAQPRVRDAGEVSILEALLADANSGHDIGRMLAEDSTSNGKGRER